MYYDDPFTFKYKINRPLTASERTNHLDSKQEVRTSFTFTPVAP
jgi:hypothetical protein